MRKVEFFSILFTDTNELHYDFKNLKQMKRFNKAILKKFSNYYIENYIINNVTYNSYQVEYNINTDTMDRIVYNKPTTKYNNHDYNIIHLDYENNYITSEF